MKRRAFQIVVLLVLGAIVNVAVASSARARLEMAFLRAEPFVAFNGRLYDLNGNEVVYGNPPVPISAGFPFPIARHLFDLDLENVIWPGFAINSIFYAAMLWVVFFVPGMVRRRVRRRRGLCPACAYPIGTSPVCTECGAHIEGTPDNAPISVNEEQS